jgi:putative Holliday junction resolvase
VGLALTDELMISAQPLAPLEIRGLSDLLDQLAPLITENKVAEVVLGRPTKLNGADTDATGLADRARDKIAARFKLPVHLYDERFTSKIAQQTIHLAGKKLKNNKKALDSISASLILSDYLKLHATKDSD